VDKPRAALAEQMEFLSEQIQRLKADGQSFHRLRLGPQPRRRKEASIVLVDLRPLWFERREMVAQQVVHEPVSPAHSLQQHSLGGIVQKTGVIPGSQSTTPKHEAKSEMLDTRSGWNQCGDESHKKRGVQ
jgi:hypothetical protein